MFPCDPAVPLPLARRTIDYLRTWGSAPETLAPFGFGSSICEHNDQDEDMSHPQSIDVILRERASDAGTPAVLTLVKALDVMEAVAGPAA